MLPAALSPAPSLSPWILTLASGRVEETEVASPPPHFIREETEAPESSWILAKPHSWRALGCQEELESP